MGSVGGSDTLNSVQERTLAAILEFNDIAREQRDLQARQVSVSQEHLSVQKEQHQWLQYVGAEALKFLRSPLGVIMMLLAILALIFAAPPAIESAKHLFNWGESSSNSSDHRTPHDARVNLRKSVSKPHWISRARCANACRPDHR